MESYSYEDLNASFSLEEPLFSTSESIDTLCETYLNNMETYSSGAKHSQKSLFEEMEAFSKMEIHEWRGEECVDWAGSVCRRQGLDQTTVDLWAFRNTSGSLLQQYSLQDFCSLVGDIYGPLFYNELQALRKRSAGCRKAHESGMSLYGGGDCSSPEMGYPNDAWDLTSEDIQELDRYIRHEESWDPLVDSLQYMDLQEQFGPIKYEEPALCPEPVAMISASADAKGASDPLKKIRPEAKKRERGPKNWEFVIRLLADPSTNPSLIRWEEQSEGTFRLVQPTTIAKMWGQRADKPNLSYDNFARGLRYHYSTGALQPVSEKQLVYRCGPKALKYYIELKRGQC
ncbi:ETS homologous factor-like [Penaeus indicus]|uniref:ETS homologous factor-like n=1 Tax=Penaeus indicus TaxID=29960 RepID=UPI00300C14AE